MKYYICPKCKCKTTVSEKELMIRAGDDGYTKEKIIRMDCCGFVPFILPESIKDDSNGNNNS